MNSTTISTKAQFDYIIQNYFLQVSEKNKTIEFFLKFFQNFVVNEGKPNGFDLKQCVDVVNKLLSEPVKNLLKSENISSDERKKITIWNDAQREFEVKLQLELIKIGNSMEKSDLLFQD